jgi:hypothetical protein
MWKRITNKELKYFHFATTNTEVIFLIGGFGSNEFLAKYLSSQIGLGPIVKQPGGG